MGKGKDAAEKIQDVWIVEIPELAGLSKMDVNNIKGFLSRQDDQYRPSYGRTVESHPRQCIIVGSTNAVVSGKLLASNHPSSIFSAMMHTTTPAMKRIRSGDFDSRKNSMPTTAPPTVPIPVQTE